MTVEHTHGEADYARRFLVLTVEPEKGGITTMCGFRESAPEDFPRTKVLVARDLNKGAHLIYALSQDEEEDVGSGPIELGPGVSVTSGKKCLVPRKFKPASDQPIMRVTKGLIDRCKAARMAASANGALDTAPIDTEAVTPALDTSTTGTTNMANFNAGSGNAPMPSPAAQTTASVPFMITQDVKAKLTNLGYTPEQISNMRPAEAIEITTAGTRASSLVAHDRTLACGLDASPSPAPEPPADREAQTNKTEASDMANPQKIDTESRGDAPGGLTRPVSTKPAVIKQPYPSKLEAALDHARCRFSVFPLMPNTKVPRKESHGCYDGTTDEAQIRAWWEENPDYNIGIHTKGLAVADVDPKNGGNKTFEALAKEHNFPPTRISKTRSDGFHWLYGLPPGASVAGGAHKLGDGVDILSDGRYIVAPGSSIDGRFYTWQNDFPIEMVPEWLPELCGRAKPRSENAGKRLVPEDDTAVELAQEYMKRQPAAEVGTIDDTQYKMAARCGDFGCGVDTIEELLTEWCMKHDIPTSQKRLREIASSGLRNRENAIGARHPSASGFEAVEIDESKNPFKKPCTAPQDDDSPISYRDLLKRTVPPVKELVSGLIQKGIVTFLSGPGAVHKSRIAQQFGLSIDAGVRVFGKDVERARFIYLSCEDEIDEVTRRAQTITRRLQLPEEPAANCWDRRGKDATLAVVKESGECVIQPFWERLHAYLRSIPGHKFIVCDGTYNVLRFEGHAKVNETSVMYAIGVLQRLCDETDSTMLSLWHPSQAGLDRGSLDGWSVAWHNAPRARLSLTKDDQEGAFNLKVEKRSHGQQGEIIRLHWNEGVLLPRSESVMVEDKAKLQDAAVAVAIKAAEKKRPIQSQRHLENWQMEEIERRFGHRALEKEVKASLATALSEGKLQYIHGDKYLAAGYYPPGADRAAELAREAKRSQAKPKTPA